jgi:hypothetical protein
MQPYFYYTGGGEEKEIGGMWNADEDTAEGRMEDM